jgi:hypothetical protein
METYDYTWKIGIEHATGRALNTNRPLVENTILIDLYTGRGYLVQKVYAAQPKDKIWFQMPDAAIQTWPVGTLTQDELSGLREKVRYILSESSRPFDDMVFA